MWSNSLPKNCSLSNCKFSSIARPEQTKYNWKRPKLTTVLRTLQFVFTCFGYARTTSKKPFTRNTWESCSSNSEMSWAVRKKIWLKVYNCARNKLKKDKNSKNSSGWVPSSTGSMSSSVGIYNWTIKMKWWIFCSMLPATSWSIVWENPVISCSRKKKNSKQRSSISRRKSRKYSVILTSRIFKAKNKKRVHKKSSKKTPSSYLPVNS